MASNVVITKKYLHRVLNSLARSKMVSSILFFKSDGKVIMNANDEKGQCRICIKSGLDNFEFDGDELGVYDLSQMLKYVQFINYGKDEKASISRVESKTTRGTRYDSLLMQGAIGKFVVTLPHADVFSSFNRMQTVSRDTTVASEQRLATFALSKEEINELESIAHIVGAEKMSISLTPTGINIYFRGGAGNQYTKELGIDHVRLYAINGDKTYLDDRDFERFIPFSVTILNNASSFNENFVFDLVRRVDNGMLALKAFGGLENTIQENEKYDIESSNIEYTIMTAVNISDESSGTANDIFEQFN